MRHIHCGPNLQCPQNLNFAYEPNHVRRAGIIPYMVYNGITYVLLGMSKDKTPVWADLGGRSESSETPLETAIREFNEESRHVMSLDLKNRLSKILLTGRDGSHHPDQMLLIVEVDPSPYNININNIFQTTTPKTQYEDEMSYLQWIPYDTFLSMNGTTSSIKAIQDLLNTL